MKKILALTLLTILCSVPAFSEEEKAGPCRADILNFCSGVKGKREVVKCLRQNEKDLSPSCKSQFAEAKSALKDCKVDMKKLCKNAGKGRGKMLQCLKENSAKISPLCKSHVDRQ